MNKVTGAILLVRPHNVLAAVLSTLTGFKLSGAEGIPWELLIAIAFAVSAGNVINDYYDLDIDRINKPHRPLPSGLFDPVSVKIFYAVLLVALVILLLRLDMALALWIGCWMVLLHLYSAKFKRMFMAGNLLVAIVASSGFFLGAFRGGDIAAGIVPASLSFFFILGRELVKDCEDVEGDRACGAGTVPVISGKRVALNAASTIFIILMVLFPLPYIAGLYGSGYGVVIVASIIPILIVSVVLSLKGRHLGTVSVLLKIGMFFGITGFYIAAI